MCNAKDAKLGFTFNASIGKVLKEMTLIASNVNLALKWWGKIKCLVCTMRSKTFTSSINQLTTTFQVVFYSLFSDSNLLTYH